MTTVIDPRLLGRPPRTAPVADGRAPGRGWAPGQARPHVWPCRHCGMVTDYHLTRDAQLRRAESLDRRDEPDQAVTFKDWLRAYEWDDTTRWDGFDDQPDPDTADDADAAWAGVWAAHQPSGIDSAASTGRPDVDPITVARAAVNAIPQPRDGDDTATRWAVEAAADGDSATDVGRVDGKWRAAS